MNKLKTLKLVADAKLPTRTHQDDCGLDIYSLEDGIVEPGQGKLFKTGIALEIEPNHVGWIVDRSSMGKKGFKVAGGIIDPQYRGEISVVLRNITHNVLAVKAGDRIAQLLVVPICLPVVLEVDKLSDTTRGTGSFGSSGA